jgi:NAD(P)-dependent dehydrogenase (short-subunit alcohol dehydrogenase family)
VAAIRSEGGEAHPFGSDAREEDQVIALVDQIERDIGPIAVFVFNVGGNVQFPITKTTSRVYRKVWEMACFGGFLTGREVARRMLTRNTGTMIFTGATASVRGAAGFSAFAGAKHALRGLAQSMARELGPQGIHVAHSIIDGPIETEFTLARPDLLTSRQYEDSLLQPDDIAEAYWAIHRQGRSAWTHELDLRPWGERW